MQDERDRRSPEPRVAILTGSTSDLPTVRKAEGILEDLGIGYELRVLSAHRTPKLTIRYVQEAEERGIEVFIACAGMANHLAGAVAAHTLKPVIGVPLTSGDLGGVDSLYSTVQMPPGIPVATVAIDGSKNAAYLAARILSLSDPSIVEALRRDLNRQRERYSATEPPD